MERFNQSGNQSMPVEEKLLSIIVPTLNEEKNILRCLDSLMSLPGCDQIEVIVVDGGSDDETLSLVTAFFKRNPEIDGKIITAEVRGRAAQMNFGADHSKGEILLFLHADSRLHLKALEAIRDFNKQLACDWGYFRLVFDDQRIVFRVISWFINKRTRLTKVATGDLALFVKRDFFFKLGGFPDIKLMEDVAFSKVLREKSHAFQADPPVETSARRWQKKGIVKTVLLMWYLRLAYFFGASPDYLHSKYY